MEFKATEAPLSEDSRPKFWYKEIMISERVASKVDPTIFLRNFVQPFMVEFAKATATARLTGKAFQMEAQIRFPVYLNIGGSNDTKGNGEKTSDSPASPETEPSVPVLGTSTESDRKED